MAKASDCIASIKQALPGAKPSEIKALVEEMDNIRSRIYEENPDLTRPEFQKKAMDFINELRYQAASQRKQAAENLLKNIKNLNRVTQEAFKDNPFEALRGLFAGMTTRISEGGNDSIYYMMHGLRGDLFKQLELGLKEAGVDTLMEKGLMDKEVMQELFELRPGGEPGVSNNPHALAAAKVIKAVNDNVLRNLQNSGSAIREMEGYIMKQAHDRTKIATAGGFEGEAAMEKWAQDIYSKLDIDKTFGTMPMNERAKYLKEAWEDIVQGRFGTNVDPGVSDRFMTVFGESQNLSKRTSRSRSLHFKDAESFYDYNQQYGNKNLIESTIAAIDRSSRDAALMYHLGTNPEAAFQALIKRTEASYAGDPKALKTITDNKDALQRYYDAASGKLLQPGTSMLAQAGQAARAVESMMKLGSSIFSSFGDLAAAAAQMKSGFGKNLLEHTGSLVSDYLGAFANAEERKLWAQRLSIYLEDAQGHLYAKYGAEQSPPGMISNGMRFMNKINGMASHVEASKVAMAKQVAISLAEHAGTPIEALPTRVATTLSRYGIDGEMWKTMSRGVEEIQGLNVMTPEGIDRIPEDFFANGRKGKFDAKVKLLNLLNEQADISSTTTGLRQKAWMGKDEGLGTLARLGAQFRGVAHMTLETTERILLNNPDTQPRNLKEAVLQGKGDFGSLAQYMVMATAMGYAGLTAREAAQGKTPRNPVDPKTFMESFAKGGAGGIYVDFMMGELTKGKMGAAANFILGPVGGDIANTADLAAKAAKGDGKAKDAVQFLTAHMPNLFYLRGAMDYLFLNQLNEHFNPGYLNRMEKRVKQNPGLFDKTQQFYVSPKEANPWK